MRLALSSAAAPDATLSELAAAARRRGLRALELEQGHGHGLLQQDGSAFVAARAALREQGVEVAAIRLHDLAGCELHGLRAAALGAALLLPAAAALAAPGALVALRAAGVDAVLAFPDAATLLAADARLIRGGCGVSCDVLPARDNLLTAAPALVKRWGVSLRHLRLHGGGPEAVSQAGLGVDVLMRELALGSFHGSLALAPSAHRFRVVWSAWLGRRGGWGCGGEPGARTSLTSSPAEAV